MVQKITACATVVGGVLDVFVLHLPTALQPILPLLGKTVALKSSCAHHMEFAAVLRERTANDAAHFATAFSRRVFSCAWEDVVDI